jgi:hypothetical protein
MGHSYKQSQAKLETVTFDIPTHLLAEILYPNKLGILLRLENNGLARHDCLRLTPDRKLDAVGAAGPHHDLVRGGRLVRVKQRLVFGCLEQVQARLDQWRWKINTAFVERLNLTIWQHIPALGRRAITRAQSPLGLSYQTALFFISTTSVSLMPPYACPWTRPTPPADRACSSAGRNACLLHLHLRASAGVAAGLTDHIWSLREVLLYRVPPSRQAQSVA